MPPDVRNSLADYVFHPAMLDAAIHIMGHPAFSGNYDRDQYHLPHKVDTVTLHPALSKKPFPKKIYTYATCIKWTTGNYTSPSAVMDLNTPSNRVRGHKLRGNGRRRESSVHHRQVGSSVARIPDEDGPYTLRGYFPADSDLP